MSDESVAVFLRQTDRDLVDIWKKAERLHNYVIQNPPSGTYDGSPRHILFHALYDLLLEHHGGILLLLASSQQDGSGLALLRPLIETCARAFWVLHCASENKLMQISRRQESFPQLKHCLNAVEDFFQKTHNASVFKLSPTYMEDLHGFTHSGVEQIQFRFHEADNELQVRPNYPPAALIKLLEHASMWLTFASIVWIQKIEGKKHVVSPNTEKLTNFYLDLFA